MLRDLSRSLLGRLVSLGIFALGFWVLYQGLLREDNLLMLGLGVVVGSALILGGLYLMATTRRLAARAAAQQDAGLEESRDEAKGAAPEAEVKADMEEAKGDTLDGSGKGD